MMRKNQSKFLSIVLLGTKPNYWLAVIPPSRYKIWPVMKEDAGDERYGWYHASYAIQNGLSYVTESRRKGLFLNDPIYKNVTLPYLHRLSLFVPGHWHEVDVTLEAITQVNVQPPDPLNKVGKLSGGNQQKVAIARWLTFPPKIFIVSEPTRGMDVGAKNDVLSILRNLRNYGYGILVVSSEPETVLAVSDQIITISRRRITAHLDNQDIDKDVLMRLIWV